jgi:hypothetical protein
VLNIVIHWKAREIASENTLEGDGECKWELYIIISDSLTNEQLFTHAYHRQNDHWAKTVLVPFPFDALVVDQELLVKVCRKYFTLELELHFTIEYEQKFNLRRKLELMIDYKIYHLPFSFVYFFNIFLWKSSTKTLNWKLPLKNQTYNYIFIKGNKRWWKNLVWWTLVYDVWVPCTFTALEINNTFLNSRQCLLCTTACWSP